MKQGSLQHGHTGKHLSAWPIRSNRQVWSPAGLAPQLPRNLSRKLVST